MNTFSDIRTGDFIKYNGFVQKILEKSDDDSSKIAVKFKTFNFDTGETEEHTADPALDAAKPDLEEKELKLVEKTEGSYLFFEEEPGEYYDVVTSLLGENHTFIKEGSSVRTFFYRGIFASLELPRIVSMEVKQTEDIEKNSTNTDFIKDARLSNGHVIKVPAFIKTGDKVQILLDNGEYIRRDE